MDAPGGLTPGRCPGVQRRLWLGGGQGTVKLTDAKPQAVDSQVNLQKQRRGAACCAPTFNPPAENLLEPPPPERRRRREQLFGHRRRHRDEEPVSTAHREVRIAQIAEPVPGG